MLTPILMLIVSAIRGNLGDDFSSLLGTRFGVDRNPILVFKINNLEVISIVNLSNIIFRGV